MGSLLLINKDLSFINDDHPLFFYVKDFPKFEILKFRNFISGYRKALKRE